MRIGRGCGAPAPAPKGVIRYLLGSALMQIGVIFPQTEIGSDPGAIRDYVQAVEDLGYAHLFIADHVLGADPRHHQHIVRL